ncbi:MAG: hypothetical protein JRJ38_04860 [Deltaproteobacteria bacterium]|nr:hypothetical protein [Deltaproteobacteria bacterium]
MALIVNTNVAAVNSQRNLGISHGRLGTSIERLSSGLRINRAADDPAGIAIAAKFATQVRGLNQAVRNVNNAIALAQTAEGGINTVTDMLHRLRELAVQASSDDNTPSDRATLASEADQLVAELTRTVNTTEYNTMPLLDGGFVSKYFQIGSNYGQNISFTINDTRARSLGGRAEYSADIADGVVNAVNANFGAGEFKINTYGVATTNSSDDQYSVLDISSNQLDTIALSANANLSFNINGTNVGVTLLSGDNTGAQVAASIVAAINNAGITDVTARTVNGSGWVIEAKQGANLALQFSATGSAAAVASLGELGMTGTLSTMFGATSTATTVNNYNGESSAIAKAVAINSVKANSGVQATAKANVVTGSGAVAAGTIHSGDVYINGVNIGAVTVEANDSTGALVTAINNQSASTGVTATTDSDNKLVLTAADGRNISVTVNEAADYGYLNLDSTYFTGTSAVFRSTVQLNDDESFDLTGTLSDLYDAGSGATNDMTKTSDTSKSQASDVSTYNMAGISINTQDGAQAAILTIDAALDDVNAIRGDLGAMQNRLQFAVANLEVASENMSASESRIRDADFAFEVSQFTRNQILVQAGTAMLAQANTIPQIALQLLG